MASNKEGYKLKRVPFSSGMETQSGLHKEEDVSSHLTGSSKVAGIRLMAP